MKEETFTGTCKEFWMKYGDRFYFDMKTGEIKEKSKANQTLYEKRIWIETAVLRKDCAYMFKEEDVKYALKKYLKSPKGNKERTEILGDKLV